MDISIPTKYAVILSKIQAVSINTINNLYKYFVI